MSRHTTILSKINGPFSHSRSHIITLTKLFIILSDEKVHVYICVHFTHTHTHTNTHTYTYSHSHTHAHTHTQTHTHPHTHTHKHTLTNTHRCPSLLIIDNLHVLCPRYDSGPSENERKLIASLCSQLDILHRTPPPAHVIVIATTNQIDGVEPSLRRPGRFDKEVEIPVPTASDRRMVHWVVCKS